MLWNVTIAMRVVELPLPPGRGSLGRLWLVAEVAARRVCRYHPRVRQQPLPKAVFRERLRTYLMGVGIGLVLVGFLFASRARMARQAQTPQGDQTQSTPATAPDQ